MLRESIIAPARIVESRIRTLVGFLDQAVREQFLNGAVKRAWAKTDLTICRLSDLLHNRVAVPLRVAHGKQDVKCRGRERQKVFQIVHASTISVNDISGNDIFWF